MPEFDLNAVMQRIQNKAACRKPAEIIGFRNSISAIADRVQSANVSTPAPIVDQRNEYSLSELMAWQGDSFIFNAYWAILGRAADAYAQTHFLPQLVTGKRSKIELLARLRYSPEGRKRGVQIKGLLPRVLVHLVGRIPILGYVLRLTKSILVLPVAARQVQLRIDQVDDKIMRLQREISEDLKQKVDTETIRAFGLAVEAPILRLTRLTSDLKHTLSENADELADVGRTASTKADLHRLAELAQRLDNQNERNLRELGELRQQLEVQSQKINACLTASMQDIALSTPDAVATSLGGRTVHSHTMDSIYAALEDEFKATGQGSRPEFSEYLPMIKRTIATGLPPYGVDLACGRGEWLEILREHNIEGIGVDLNRVMIEDCRAKGFKVVEQDVLTYLQQMDSESVTIVTAFRLIERLSPEKLLQLFLETPRVLRKGGIAIFETPNPENILVGAHTFYSNPTHTRPFPAILTKFLAEIAGFSNVEVWPLHPFPQDHLLKGDDPVVDFINRNFFAPQDYAIVAKK